MQLLSNKPLSLVDYAEKKVCYTRDMKKMIIISLVLFVCIVTATMFLFTAENKNDTHRENLGGYGGLNLDQAQELANSRSVPLRVVEQDGEFFTLTADYVPGRVNVEVENNIIVGYTIEE